MSAHNAITLANFDALAPLGVNEEFLEAKLNALQQSKSVESIANSMQQGFALLSLAAIDGLIKQVEASRVDVKSGPLELCKRIDGIAKSATSDLSVEKERLKTILATYQRKLDEEERARKKAEQERLAAIELERLAALRKAEEAAKALAPQEAAKVVAKAEAESTKAAQQAQQQVLAAAPVVRKPENTTIRRPWRYEILDLNALHKAHPELVDLTPRARDILNRINAGAREIPGLRIYQAVEVSTR